MNHREFIGVNVTATPDWRLGLIGLKPILLTACCLIPFGSGTTLSTAAEAATNLALSARASAFEFQPGLPASLANDGNMDSRWSGIPGHNVGGWYELTWERPVRIGQVLAWSPVSWLFKNQTKVRIFHG